jgi:hypothetical protein
MEHVRFHGNTLGYFSTRVRKYSYIYRTLGYGFHFQHRNPRTFPIESLAHDSGRTSVRAECGYPKGSPNTDSYRRNLPLQLSMQCSPQRTPKRPSSEPLAANCLTRWLHGVHTVRQPTFNLAPGDLAPLELGMLGAATRHSLDPLNSSWIGPCVTSAVVGQTQC